MAEFTAVFMVEEDGSVDIKEGCVECVKEKDSLSTTSQSTKGKRGTNNELYKGSNIMLKDANLLINSFVFYFFQYLI